MIGKGEKFRHFECDPFDLPKQIEVANCEFRNERHFIEFLVRNDWIQRKLGLRMPRVTNGFFPDLRSFVLADRCHPEEIPISVEVELWAENYRMHGHEYRGCDLILSFFRSPETRFVKGVPVWSFYECFRNDKWGLLSLYGDIKYDFSEHIDEDELSNIERLIFRKHGVRGLKKMRENTKDNVNRNDIG